SVHLNRKLARYDPRRFRAFDPPAPGTERARAHVRTDAAARHAARAGGRAAGVAALPARLRAPSPDATVPRRDVGGADARVQRGPGVLVTGLGHHLIRAAPHDLRFLRSGARTSARAA